jgi:hypothetical protein
VASIAVLDPDIFNGASGQTFTYAYGLIGGYFSVQADGAGAAANITTDVGSNIPGLENFFSLTMGQDGDNPSAIKVKFSSNPRLGLEDAAVESNITSHLIFDSLTSTYRLDADLQYAVIAVTVPIGQDIATFTWNTRAMVAASIPEPSSLVLLSSGFAALLCCRKSKRWGLELKRVLTLDGADGRLVRPRSTTSRCAWLPPISHRSKRTGSHNSTDSA